MLVSSTETTISNSFKANYENVEVNPWYFTCGGGGRPMEGPACLSPRTLAPPETHPPKAPRWRPSSTTEPGPPGGISSAYASPLQEKSFIYMEWTWSYFHCTKFDLKRKTTSPMNSTASLSKSTRMIDLLNLRDKNRVSTFSCVRAMRRRRRQSPWGGAAGLANPWTRRSAAGQPSSCTWADVGGPSGACP